MKNNIKILLVLICFSSCKESFAQNHTAPKEIDKSSLEKYENNENYFIKTFDANKDGIEDKIVSHNRYQGDELLIFLGNKNNSYSLTLETTNFSQDGGNQISDIKATSEGFEIITNFPDRGHLQYKYLISTLNSSFILNKIESENSSWQNGYKENCVQNLAIDLEKGTDELFNQINITSPNCTKTNIVKQNE